MHVVYMYFQVDSVASSYKL